MSDVIIPGGPEDKKRKKQPNAPKLTTPLTLREAFIRGRKYALDGQQRGLDTDMREFLEPTTRGRGPLQTLNKAIIAGIDLAARAAEEVGATGMGAIRAGAEVAKNAGVVDDADRLAGEVADIGMIAGVAAGTGVPGRSTKPKAPKAKAIEAIAERRAKKGLPIDNLPKVDNDNTKWSRDDRIRRIIDMQSEGDSVADALPLVPPIEVNTKLFKEEPAAANDVDALTPEELDLDARWAEYAPSLEPEAQQIWDDAFAAATEGKDIDRGSYGKALAQQKGGTGREFNPETVRDAMAAANKAATEFWQKKFDEFKGPSETGKDAPDVSENDRINELLYRNDLTDAEYDELDALLGATASAKKPGFGGGDGMDAEGAPIRTLADSETGKDAPDNDNDRIKTYTPANDEGTGPIIMPSDKPGVYLPKEKAAAQNRQLAILNARLDELEKKDEDGSITDAEIDEIDRLTSKISQVLNSRRPTNDLEAETPQERAGREVVAAEKAYNDLAFSVDDDRRFAKRNTRAYKEYEAEVRALEAEYKAKALADIQAAGYTDAFLERLVKENEGYGGPYRDALREELAARNKAKADKGPRTGMDRQQLIADAKRLGVDITNISELNELDRLVKFHRDLTGNVKDRARALQQAAHALHTSGKLPLTVGTRILTPKAKETGQTPWTVSGYYVDSKDPNKYGYYVRRGTDGEDLERTVLIISDPKWDGERAARLAEDRNNWQIMSGPRGETGKDSDNGGTPPGAGGGDGMDGNAVPVKTAAAKETGKDTPGNDNEEGGVTREFRPANDTINMADARKASDPIEVEFVGPTDAVAKVLASDRVNTHPLNDREGPELPKGATEESSIGRLEVVTNRLEKLLAKGDLTRAERAEAYFLSDEIDRINRELNGNDKPPSGETGKDTGSGGMPPGKGGGDGLDGPPKGEKTGSIGGGQAAVPAALQGSPVPKMPRRSREDTKKAAKSTGINRVNIDEKGRIGDVAAIAEKTKQMTLQAGNEYLQRYAFFGKDSTEANEAFKAFVRNLAVHSENSSNLGRGLQSLNDGLSAKQGRRIERLANDPEYQEKFAKLIEQYKDDPDALRKIARDAMDPTLRDRIFSFRYNMMLSGPKTHVYNILGTSSNIVVDLVEHGLAAVGGLGKKALGKQDRVSGSEVVARLLGSIVGAKTGLKTMRQAYKEGRPLDDAARTEMSRGRVSAWEVPVKLLSAEDEFFRSVASMSDTYGMAVRIARKEGHTGKDLFDRITDLINNPNKEMLDSSKEYSKRMRFQDDPSFIGQMIERARNADTAKSPYGRAAADFLAIILPFVRTPDSLLRTAVRRSPLGFGEEVNWKGLKKGGADRDLALSRIALGTGVASYIAVKAFNGEITGEGPADYKKRQALESTGWQPNSFKVGDKYYSYLGAEPLSILLSSIATMRERADDTSGKELAEQAEAVIKGLANSLTNSTWLEGIADLEDALDEKDLGSALDSWVANVAQSFTVPALTRQVNQTYFDNVQRDTRGDDSMADRVTGRIQSGIPGLSDKLPPQRDALGQVIAKGDALGPDILSRATSNARESTSVSEELERLRQLDPDKKPLVLPVPRTVNTVDFPLGRLNAKEHSHYQDWFGAHFSAMMEDLLNDEDYLSLSDEEKRDEIKNTAEAARAYAREDAFGNPDEEEK